MAIQFPTAIAVTIRAGAVLYDLDKESRHDVARDTLVAQAQPFGSEWYSFKTESGRFIVARVDCEVPS